MAFVREYSTTSRLGELYEKMLYRRVEDGGGKTDRYLDQLTIAPAGETAGFAPKLDNWRRSAKVPILILNATTLNTGHNWQFTATWMGEPPAGLTSDIDANDRLRRVYYWEAPPSYRRFRLGHAVAASACVPGLFEPLALGNLYPERSVHLVDGGVYDNQGIGGLLEQECSVVLVSDASGQMQNLKRPRGEFLDVPIRSNNILMSRVREAEFRELEARRRSGVLRGLLFLHLKKGLDVTPVDWLQTGTARRKRAPAAPPEPVTDYGIDKEVQQRLAAIRTDLDSFSDHEAFALMLSGYLMTTCELPRAVPALAPPALEPEKAIAWDFLRVRPAATLRGDDDPSIRERLGEGRENLLRLLSVSCFTGFKIWRLWPLLRAAVIVTFAAVALLLIILLIVNWVSVRPYLLEASFWTVVAAAALAMVAVLYRCCSCRSL